MWNSLARSPLVTCLIHDRLLCEKPWMKRISGPFGLPQSCAEIVSPSGVFTEAALKFLSCAVADAESAASSSAATEMLATWCRSVAGVIDRPPILSRAVSSMFRRWYDGTISHVTHPRRLLSPCPRHAHDRLNGLIYRSKLR